MLTQRHKAVKFVGYTFIGLLLLGLFAQTIIAMLAGHPFIGRNYLGLDIGAYSTFATLVLCAMVAIAVGAGRIWLLFNRGRPKGDDR